MKSSITTAIGLLLLTSCGVARSQPKTQVVAGPAGKPLAVAGGARSSPKDLAKPTDDFLHWSPSTSLPELDCPKGTTQEKRTSESGWETWCARGAVKHGPARAFDKAARRESRQIFADGALSGWSTEITIRPTISLEGNQVNSAEMLRGAQSVEELTTISAELKDWAPNASPPALNCPAGTSQAKESSEDMWTVECRRPDGSAHGPSRTQHRHGIEQRRLFLNGAQLGPTLTINDGRTVRDTLYQKGVMTRRLERTMTTLLTLEVFRGDKHFMVRFYPSGAVAQLSRFSKGVRAGEWRSWNESGALTERTTYQNGDEQPGSERRDEKGNVIEVRKLVKGTGTIERVAPGRDFEKEICEMKAGKRHGHCRTTTKGGQLLDDMTYVDGVAVERKIWWESGGLRSEWAFDVKTGDSKQTGYNPQGRVEQTSECSRSNLCTMTEYDEKGNPKPPAGTQGSSSAVNDEVMRALDELL